MFIIYYLTPICSGRCCDHNPGTYLHKNTDKTQQIAGMCLYFLPDDGRMKDRNMSQKMMINERTVFGCCIRVECIAND
jgi:hypothetical protein